MGKNWSVSDFVGIFSVVTDHVMFTDGQTAILNW